MKNKNAPDFLVHWKDKSLQSTLELNIEPTVSESTTELNGKLRNGFVLLNTSTAIVAVNEIPYTQATNVTFTPNRIGFSLLVASTASVKYGYGNNAHSSSGPGNLLLMLPGREIHASISPGTMRTVTCTFNIDYAESIIGPLEAISEVRLLDTLNIRSSLVSAVMFRLMNEAIYPGAISEKVVKALGQTLLVECAHWLTVDKEPSHKVNQLTAQDFELIEQYLAGENKKAPSVSELASICGFSERYFSKLFREQTGCSVSQYFKSIKVAKAKAYLLETDLPLKEIAFRLGYSTPSNFSYSFRAATGSTPAKFRLSNS